MNKQLRHFFKVGLFFVLTVGLIAFSLLFLRGKLNNDKHLRVVFTDARGLKEGENVEMAGVTVGQVDRVRLRPEDNKAEVEVGIRKDVRIPQNSIFRVTAGILGNNRMLEVVPGPAQAPEIPDRTVLEGDSGSPLDETLAQGRKLLEQGQQLATSINKIAGDPKNQRSIQTVLANSAELTDNLKKITDDFPKIERKLDALTTDLQVTLASGRRAAAGAERITQNAEVLSRKASGIADTVQSLTKNLNTTLVENRTNLKSLIQSADEAASAVAGLTGDVRANLNDPNFKQNLQTATENLAAITAKLDAVTSDFQRLSSDPRLSSDLRETLGNLKETSASVRNITARIEGIRLPGEKRSPNANGGADTQTPRIPPLFSTTSLLEPGFVLDSLYDTKSERLRVDGNFTLLSQKRQFYRAGLSDATEGNRVNLQVGQSNAPATFAYRYGLFASKLGVGFDTRTGPLDLRFDFYDPNRFTVNARVKAYLNRNAALTFGVDSLGAQNRATVGVQIRR